MPIGVSLEIPEGKGAGFAGQALPGTAESIPGGVENQLYYNGLEMNVLTNIDRYRIIEIGGLGDADIRDTRDNNPSSDGETAFNAYYGGRTITLTGRIEAHNLGKLRDMQEAMRGAFATLEEQPLYFLTGDPTTNHYINCRKSQSLSMGEVQKDHDFYRDFLITLRASDPRFVSQRTHTTTIYPNNVVNPSFEGGTTHWTKTATSWTASTFERTREYAAHGEWGGKFTGTKDATTTERELMLQTDTGTSGMPVIELERYTVQFSVNVVNASNRGFQLRVDWYTSRGALVSTSKTELSTGTGSRVVRATFEAPATSAFAAVSIVAISTESSDGIDIRYDNVWFVRGAPETVGYGFIGNSGNFTTLPLIRAYGRLVSLKLTNEANGQVLKACYSAVTIENGKFYVFDIARRTLFNSEGENRFGDFDERADWLTLSAGENFMFLDVENTGESTSAKVEIVYRNAWL